MLILLFYFTSIVSTQFWGLEGTALTANRKKFAFFFTSRGHCFPNQSASDLKKKKKVLCQTSLMVELGFWVNRYRWELTFEPAVNAELLTHFDSSSHLFLKSGGARNLDMFFSLIPLKCWVCPSTCITILLFQTKLSVSCVHTGRIQLYIESLFWNVRCFLRAETGFAN